MILVGAPLQAASSKLCCVCGKCFFPFLSTETVCSVRCAIKVGPLARKAAKADRVKTRARIDELRPLSYWAKQAQWSFNAWIKARDASQPCISCGTTKPAEAWIGGDGYHAGHFLSTAAAPELRFDESNVHKQCIKCNVHLSGNIARYRISLIERIGQAEVDRLEGPHPPRQLRAGDLKRIRDEYRARLKAPANTEFFDSSTA